MVLLEKTVEEIGLSYIQAIIPLIKIEDEAGIIFLMNKLKETFPETYPVPQEVRKGLKNLKEITDNPQIDYEELHGRLLLVNSYLTSLI